jgi:hypothetical protein
VPTCRAVADKFLLARQVRAAAPSLLTGSSKQVRSYAAEAKASPTEVSSILEQRIRGVHEEAGLAETGRVLSVGYGLHLHEYAALISFMPLAEEKSWK